MVPDNYSGKIQQSSAYDCPAGNEDKKSSGTQPTAHFDGLMGWRPNNTRGLVEKWWH